MYGDQCRTRFEKLSVFKVVAKSLEKGGLGIDTEQKDTVRSSSLRRKDVFIPFKN